MVERHRALGLGQGLAQIELEIIGQERAGDDGRCGGAFAFDHHARGGAHHVIGGFMQDIPAGCRDFRDFGA